jgi:uncharacterized protein (TIGR02145 family)
MIRRLIFTVLISILAMLIACDKPEETDEVAPVVTITNPVSGTTVEGSVVIQTDAMDDESVERVEIWINSVLVYTDTESPWEYIWGTDSYADGNQHSIQAKAIDPSGNIGESEFVRVTVLVLNTSTVMDIDGNIYQTVEIGDQIWMAENLKVTHYRNNDSIQYVQSESLEPDVWESLTTGAYGYYDDDQSHQDTYGNLYNWYAVADSRNIAPDGWHVPTDDEWQSLVDNLGGFRDAGGKLKEIGTSNWNSPNTGATDESGFTALPGGYRYSDDGNYYTLGNYGYFWSASEHYGTSNPTSLLRTLYYDATGVRRNYLDRGYGFAIRCVRD